MERLRSLFYRRPKAVAKSLDSGDSSKGDGTDASLGSDQSYESMGIPDSLSFDNIMNGGTCPPMTIRDFMNFLVYVEHSAENLQFWLWYKDYVKRFEQAPEGFKVQTPAWTRGMEEETMMKVRKEQAEKQRHKQTMASMYEGAEFDNNKNKGPEKGIFGTTSPRTRCGNGNGSGSDGGSSVATSSIAVSKCFESQAAAAYSSAGVWQPFTAQPFRNEINRIVATYLVDGAPRQLNLSAAQQKTTVQALAHTTHPSALRTMFEQTDTTLRQQAHANFLRWSIGNGNAARARFAMTLGVGLVALGLVGALVLTLSSAGRGFRALVTATTLVPGISTLVAAHKGMCIVLHGLHHRQLRPWELFHHDDEHGLRLESFEFFGPGTGCSNYEDEPWLLRYRRRPLLRRIFDRQVWIQEPALRQIQDTIFLQAILAALVVAGVVTAIFVVVPCGNFF